MDTQNASPATDNDKIATHAPAGAETSSGQAATQTLAGEGTPSGQTTPQPNGPAAPQGAPPGFSERGRMRRRMRFLRKARELAYRDLGGLVFDLHRFGRRNDALVLAKLETIGRIDTELRALEATLSERRPVTVLREAGVAACPRCAAIHGSDDRFCPNCGLAMDLRAERPMAGPQTPPAPAPTPPTAAQPPAMPTTAPAISPTPAPAPSPASASTPAPASPFGSPTSTLESSSPSPATPPAPAAVPAPAPSPPPSTPPSSSPPASAPAPPSSSPPAPAPAPASPRPPATAHPAGPAPTVDQPTEIVRPPAKDP